MPVILARWETKFKAGLAIYQGPGSKEGSGVGWTLVEQPVLREDGDEYTSHHGDHSDGAPQHLVNPGSPYVEPGFHLDGGVIQ